MSLRFISFPVWATLTLIGFTSQLSVNAQIIPDRTLGSENSVVTPNQNIRGINSDRIDGGAVRGGNLFHSFEEFNVDVGRGAYFSNPDNIINILTRVTGGNISEILGTLGVLGNANFFLINPNGIVFGPNAQLDVGGSFFATTADGILFENGIEFAANNPEAPPLLTINMPLGLNIRENPGTIVNQATLTTLEDGSTLRDNAGFLIPQGLNVPQNQTLALVGGDVIFDNGVAISPGSNIELGGLSEPGIVQINPDQSLTFPENIQQANVALTNQSQINVRADGGRDININARNFEMSSGSIIRAGFDEGLGFPEAQAGDVNINTQENIVLRDSSFISSIIDIDSQGNPGDINIETRSLLMENEAIVSASTFGPGNAGSVSILATDSVALSNSFLLSNVEEGAVGNGGGIEIITGNLFMSEGSKVSSFTLGQGDGGLVSVQATNLVELSGQDTALLGGSNPTAIGQGGNVTVNTSSLILRENAIIDTSTLGQGNAGSVLIFATDSVELFSGNIFSGVGENAVGNGNTVTIETRNLLLSEGSEIQSLTFGEGDAGNINIKAESVQLTGTSADGSGASIITASSRSGEGNAGTIVVETERLQINDGGVILADGTGTGNAGTIFIQASDVQLRGFAPNSTAPSGLSASVEDEGIGNSGNIIIETARLLLEDGGFIRVRTAANTPGNTAGQILITASESVTLKNTLDPGSVAIITDTLGSRDAPPITIFTQFLLMEGASGISALAGSLDSPTIGGGGDISIFASEQVQLRGTTQSDEIPRISATTFGAGNAGNIRIETPQLVIDSGIIAVTSEELSGNAGTIQVLASESVELLNQGALLAGTGGEGNAGNIIVETPQLVLRDEASIRVGSLLSTSGNAGNITIKTGEFSIQDQASLSASTDGDGDAGDIIINSSELVEVRDQADITASTGDTGNAGNIRIETNQFVIQDEADILAGTTTDASGNAGNIIINSSELVEVRDQADITASTGGTGNAGNIRIETNQFVIQDEAGILARTTTDASGNAGNIIINSSELVEVRDQADITASTGGRGDAGNININTEGQLRILDGALITVSTDEGSSGNAGSINITASELVEIRGTSADGTISVLLAETESTGDGGNVNIETGQLRLTDGAVIAVSADEGSSGNAGSINITASELVEIRAGEFATGLLAQTESTGNAGNIRIETEQFQVRDGGSVDVRSTASGRPGNIEISANETLLDNQAELNARSEAGQGGNIRLQSNDVRLFNESEIVATGSENNQTFEGNIEIDANLLVLLQGSQILTNAFSPSGGSNINIRPLDSELGLLQSQDSTISAAGELSIDNTLNFDPPEALEVTVVDPGALIAQDPCKQRGDSEFIITGRGGIAPDPTQELTSIEGFVEWESFLVEPITPPVNRSSRRRQQQARKRDNNRENYPLDSRTIVPARGWIRNSDGEVILVGYDPKKTGVQRQPNPSHSCQS